MGKNAKPNQNKTITIVAQAVIGEAETGMVTVIENVTEIIVQTEEGQSHAPGHATVNGKTIVEEEIDHGIVIVTVKVVTMKMVVDDDGKTVMESGNQVSMCQREELLHLIQTVSHNTMERIDTTTVLLKVFKMEGVGSFFFFLFFDRSLATFFTYSSLPFLCVFTVIIIIIIE